MESIIEVQRHLHEERERLVDAVSKEFLAEKRSHKDKINSDHRVKELLRRHGASTDRLLEVYDDRDGERARELRAIAGPNEFADFYSRLKALKDAHRRNPGDTAVPLNIEFQELIDNIENPDRVESEMVKFADEEGYGRFLDLNALFQTYMNLKGIKRTDYVQYVKTFDRLEDIPKDSTKKTGAYKDYLVQLEAYLTDFLMRVKPLFNVKKDMDRLDAEFDANWKQGKCRGWSKDKPHTALASAGALLNLSEFSTSKEMENLGLDRLKTALIALNMKCGGSLKERAERLFATKGKSMEELTAETLREKRSAVQIKEDLRQQNLAKIEAHIFRLAELVYHEREATKENIQRKQARAAGETDDLEEENEVVESDEEKEGDEDVPYNPKNLPLGWDGKPIPYWLYKLHGLNISYSCEICGNQTYKGPKAFQKHFTEWRHSHGMRCLGIPNTAHFANITKIEEAVGLWRKLQVHKDQNKWNPEVDEEFEDSLGNVVNRLTYEDLKRQGLL